MNTKLRTKAKNDFEKDFFKLMNNSGKTMKDVRKHRYIKLVTTDKKRNKPVPEPNYHTTKYFSGNLLAMEMKKIKVKANKAVQLGLSTLEISRTLMYEFWYDYIKPKDNAKVCYTDIDNFIIHIRTEDVYEDIADDVEKRFDTSNYEFNRPLPTGKNKKVIVLVKYELGGKIITEFVALRPKKQSYLMDDGNSDKKAKGTKMCNKMKN